jgi:putative thioredoxin
MSEHVRDVDGFGFNAQVIEASRERPVLVDFWAAWCGPCRTLTPILTRVVDQLAGRVLLAKVDVDREPALATRYGIRSLPTVLLFRDGAPVDHFMGALPEGEVRRFIDRHVQPAGPDVRALADARLATGDLAGATALLETALAADPDHTRLLAPLADCRLLAGDLEAAAALLERVPLADADDRYTAAKSRLALYREQAETAGLPVEGPSAMRYRSALAAFAAGDPGACIEGLLALVAADRGFRDDAARRALLDVFNVLGADDPRVRAARARLSSLLMR